MKPPSRPNLIPLPDRGHRPPSPPTLPTAAGMADVVAFELGQIVRQWRTEWRDRPDVSPPDPLATPPTLAQLHQVWQAAVAAGHAPAGDPSLRQFCQQLTGVDHPAWLSSAQLAHCLAIAIAFRQP